MTVNFNPRFSVVTATQVLYADPTAVEALAAAAIASMVESVVDMVCDGGESEYPDRAAIEQSLGTTRDIAIDLVNDTIDDLRNQVIKKIRESVISAKVSAIRYNDDGLYDDIDVTVTANLIGE